MTRSPARSAALCASLLWLLASSACHYGAPTAKVEVESTPRSTDLWVVPHDAWIEHTKDHQVTESDPWLQTFKKGRTNTSLTLPMTEHYALTFDSKGRPIAQLFRPGDDALVTLHLP